MAERAREGDPLLLSAGKSYAAASDDGAFTVRHGGDFAVHADRLQIFAGVSGIAEQDVLLYGVAEQLGIMTHIRENTASFRG